MTFNPDQPRDYHGRWGDGGGSPASAKGHAHIVPMSRIGYRSAEPGRNLSRPGDENAFSLRQIASTFFKDNAGSGWGPKAYRSGPLTVNHGLGAGWGFGG